MDHPTIVNPAINLTSRIGTHPRKTDDYTEIHQAGARWVRFGWAVMFDRICAGGPGTYDFENNGQALIDQSVEANLSVLAILDGRWGWEADSKNLVPWATPIWEHWDAWEDYVFRTVDRYKDRIKYWEMGNEPPFFWFYPKKEGIPHMNGAWKRAPIKYYAEKVRRTARIIRNLDPEAKIVLGSTFPDGQFLRKCYEHGLKDYFDIASVHYLHCHTRQRFRDGYDNLRAILQEHGDGDKELWDTESGPDGGELSLPAFPVEDYTGLYNIYRHCFAHEAGLQRYFWFPSERGVRHGEGKVCSSYRALGALHRHVGEGGLCKAGDFDRAAQVYVFDGPNGPASILWATAASRGRFFGKPPTSTDAFGDPLILGKEWDLDARPILIQGDLLDGSFDASRNGSAFIAVTQPLHKPNRATRAVRVPEIDGNGHPIPCIFPANSAQYTTAVPSFMRCHSSAKADLGLAWDMENLYLEATLADALDKDGRPRGVLQFTIRDSAPKEYEDIRTGQLETSAFAEWKTVDRGRFFNGYALFSLECGPRGDRVFRSESLESRAYPTGFVQSAQISHRISGEALVIRAAIPWKEIGPCRPGTAEPFLFMAGFGLTDEPLDVPVEADPADWHQNYQHGFIIKPPAEKAWLFLREKLR